MAASARRRSADVVRQATDTVWVLWHHRTLGLGRYVYVSNDRAKLQERIDDLSAGMKVEWEHKEPGLYVAIIPNVGSLRLEQGITL